MRIVGLVSGGKDSCYNLIECIREGHEIVALGNLKPAEKDELDSYMYQTVGHDVIDLYAEAVGIPLFRRTIAGSSICQRLDYEYSQDDEVEDLLLLLKDIKEKIEFDAVAAGAILSDYQRIRVENVCMRLGVKSLAYLWRRDQDELLQDMIDSSVYAVLIKVAALGLLPQRHLLTTIEEMQTPLRQLSVKYGLNICGEGGEYETMTLDCPIFLKKIVIDESETVIHSDDAFAPVGYVKFKTLHLEDKGIDSTISLSKRLELQKYPDRLLTRRVLPSCKDLEQMADEKPIDSVKTTGKMSFHAEIRFPFTKKFRRSICIGGLLAESGDGETVEVSARKAFQKLKDLLAENNCDMKDCVRIHLYLRDMELFASINDVYKEFFLINPPARVCVQVAMEQKYIFCLECSAMDRSYSHDHTVPCEKKNLHVQSISHWAPANIGPYSQAVKIGSSIFVSGSIGLDPGSMTFVQGGVTKQALSSLRHVDRVLKAIDPSSGLEDAVNITCYVVSSNEKSAVKKVIHDSRLDISQVIYQTVEVTRLPRDAFVELSVVAHRCPNRNLSVNQLEVCVQEVKILSKSCSCDCKDNGFLSVAVSTENPLDETNWDEVISEVVENLKRIILQSQMTEKNVMSLKIFCNVEIPSKMDLFPSLWSKSFHCDLPVTTMIGTKDSAEPLIIIGNIAKL